MTATDTMMDATAAAWRAEGLRGSGDALTSHDTRRRSGEAAKLLGRLGQERYRRPVALGLTRPMTTNAMPTVITAIHRAVAPMSAMSMAAPRSNSGTATQRSMCFMTAPPCASKQQVP